MNENIFQQITNDNIAYWIGFLAADGSVHQNKLEIGLSSKDIEHLYKFKKFIDYDGKITERNTLCSTNGKFYPSCYVTIKNKNIVNDLLQYKIISDKSHKNIDFLSYIPEKYKIPFILGLFDGDGWFTNTEKTINFGICGNQATIYSISQYLLNYFNWDTLKNHSYSKSPITFSFQTGSRQKILDFVELYLSYQDRCDLLQRKLNIALKLKEKVKLFFFLQEEHNNTHIYKVCPICKRNFQGHNEQVYCSQTCAHKAQQRCERPNRAILKQEIRDISFVQLGKKYGVSDKAISKWCVAYNLPSKKKDINSYSDEEWEKI